MSNDVRELLRRDVAANEYEEIRELWKKHSIAEDERDLPGLISTLTCDCVYELAQTGHRWEGHEGAARFYMELLSAFPDIHFDLTDIVIGPQGVCEEADVTGTHQNEWLGFPASGERLAWKVAIFFPWDPGRRLFRGEKIYTAGLPLLPLSKRVSRNNSQGTASKAHNRRMANLRALIGWFRRRLRGGNTAALSREIREARRKAEADADQHGLPR
jgi:hypothetical protein